jgi:hypothetical protein
VPAVAGAASAKGATAMAKRAAKIFIVADKFVVCYKELDELNMVKVLETAVIEGQKLKRYLIKWMKL